ncbi:MAG TPA: 3'-5' exonuclease [Rhodothermales bacterium]|nr:3'-5' exonuclease [Rhodothermales bacterium]HRR09565.1 3'-5' exonuclease [Rhodothermales bacterium]
MAFLVLDLELSGSEPGWHEIVQIGAVLCDNQWGERSTFLSNVYPENEESFSESSRKVHGLSLDDLDDAPMLHELLPEFEEWIIENLPIRPPKHVSGSREHALREVIICGQSVIYDINFLRYAYRQEKKNWPFSHQMLDLHTLSYLYFDVMGGTKNDTPRSRSLESVAKWFGFGRADNTHNALEDSLLTVKCFREINQRIKER